MPSSLRLQRLTSLGLGHLNFTVKMAAINNNDGPSRSGRAGSSGEDAQRNGSIALKGRACVQGAAVLERIANRSKQVRHATVRAPGREHDQAYGSRKVWKQMGREGLREARCRVRRLMRELGLVGVVRGRAWITTTQPDAVAEWPADVPEADP